MKIYNLNNLTKEEVNTLCSRNIIDDDLVKSRTEDILKKVKEKGDSALFAYSELFDNVNLSKLYLDEEELKSIANQIPEKVKSSIDTAYQNIHAFHKNQVIAEPKIETMPGVTCWRENRPIEKVGLYVPGGTAVLPSTFLMLGIPAKIAGCKEIIVCSPPQDNGKINCYIAYVALLLGVSRIYLIGGAQAIAAMAYGTETVPRVYKILGPGNRYVTEAKKNIQNTVAIDMPAGPSEVLILADETANPSYLAADLLAQAEHGIDSQSILVCTSQSIIEETLKEIDIQIDILPRKEIAAAALLNSFIILNKNLYENINFANQYAPEHLILATKNNEEIIPLIINAGSVFIGSFTPESAGDYASGTNHTLPTSSFAKAYSGVSVDSFIKKITFQQLNINGLKNIGTTVEILAEAEGLQAHKNAMSIRLRDIK